MSETPFERACGLFNLRLLDAMNLLAERKQWSSGAVLCAVAIDVLADTEIRKGKVERNDYVGYLEHTDAFEDYAPYAERVYESLRCGLVHRMQLKSHEHGEFDDEGLPAGEGPIAIGPDDGKPRIWHEYLVIDVPHLMAAFFRAYDKFKENPSGDAQCRFSERMVQILIDETK
jgi:hypothetical protein